MGFFTKGASRQTAKLKSLLKIAITRLAVVRRPRLGRRSIARGDVAQLLSIGHLERALLRTEHVIEEANMLEVLDIVELYCKILIQQAAQLDKRKECSAEIKAAAAGLMFASARCGDLPELLDARAILADKFGRDFARAAKDGSHGVVDPTLVRTLSGERASAEQQRRLAKEIAAVNDILLDFPENPREIRQTKQSEPVKNVPVPAEEPVEHIEVKTENFAVRQWLAEEKMKLRESEKQYLAVRMAAEAAFESASFAAMAARAAVELSRLESQGKGWRGSGYDKVHPVQNAGGATGREMRPSLNPQKPSSPSLSPSWSDMSTVCSVGSDAPRKGKNIVLGQSDEEGDDLVEEVLWTPPLSQRPQLRTASTMGIGGGGSTPKNSPHAPRTHRWHASELGGGNALHGDQDQRGQYRTPPYRRNIGPNADRRPRLQEDGAGESSAHVVHPPPYTRVVSALEGCNQHIARHEEMRRIGMDARALQEMMYGGSPGSGWPGSGPLTPGRTGR